MEPLNRRSFFKLVGSAAAVAMLPVSVVVAEPVVGLVREICIYDLAHQRWLIRYDIRLGADLQFGVDAAIDDLKDIERARQPALTLLRAEIESRGITDLRPVPLPIGMEHQSKYIDLEFG